MSTKVQPSSNQPARLVLSLVHLLYSILQQLLLLCSWIRWKLSTYQRKIFLNEPQNSTPVGCRNSTQLRCENDAIEYHVRGLEKIPSHLVVILGPEEPEYKQLAKFIFWSMAAGVGHVSFYDHRGTLKQNHHEMLNYVSQQPRGESEQIVWTTQLKTASGLLPPRNGYRRRVVVSFFSPDDGKRQLAATARTISNQIRTGSVSSPSAITVELVEQRLQNQFHHIPDPELAVYFGSICSTYGMLPWQIRLTEFLPLEASSVGDVKVSHFLSCLYRFAKCEQRFGK
ncbi:dehydrodolichyl diphosphate synthase complex subunit nus1 [Ochlerotatus camptorhynchus]|uniref:dehydrodolichyl diphosphate synthase complex subunit nus1 n=1 Tax=Ochlerotatus camptorhynchus TaxID=644619 RepID=UPI0031D2864A